MNSSTLLLDDQSSQPIPMKTMIAVIHRALDRAAHRRREGLPIRAPSAIALVEHLRPTAPFDPMAVHQMVIDDISAPEIRKQLRGLRTQMSALTRSTSTNARLQRKKHQTLDGMGRRANTLLAVLTYKEVMVGGYMSRSGACNASFEDIMDADPAAPIPEWRTEARQLSQTKPTKAKLSYLDGNSLEAIAELGRGRARDTQKTPIKPFSLDRQQQPPELDANEWLGQQEELEKEHQRMYKYWNARRRRQALWNPETRTGGVDQPTPTAADEGQNAQRRAAQQARPQRKGKSVAQKAHPGSGEAGQSTAASSRPRRHGGVVATPAILTSPDPAPGEESDPANNDAPANAATFSGALSAQDAARNESVVPDNEVRASAVAPSATPTEETVDLPHLSHEQNVARATRALQAALQVAEGTLDVEGWITENLMFDWSACPFSMPAAGDHPQPQQQSPAKRKRGSNESETARPEKRARAGDSLDAGADAADQALQPASGAVSTQTHSTSVLSRSGFRIRFQKTFAQHWKEISRAAPEEEQITGQSTRKAD